MVDLGVIGGSYIYEFMVLSEIGEDIIVYSNESDYVVNIEKVEVVYYFFYKYFVFVELIKVEMFNVKIV